MKTKLLTLLMLLLAVCSGAWAGVGLECATNTGTSNTDITGTSYTISGTYIAGKGAASATGMLNSGVKFRTGQNGNTLEFTVKEGYTITAFRFYGVSNYALKSEASEPCISVTKVEVDDVEVTSTGTNVFPAKGASTAGSVILSEISATEKIVLTFDNSNSSGTQVNGYYEITWSKPAVAVPVGQADTPALDPLQYETINLTDAYSFDNTSKTLVVSANRIRSSGAQAWMNYVDAGGAKKTWSATGVFKGSTFYNTGDANNAVALTSGKTYSLTVTNCNTISALVLSGSSKKTSITIQMDIYEMDVDGESKLSVDPVQTKSTTSTSEATLTATGLNASKIYRATFTSTHASSNSYVYEVAFTAPNTVAVNPTFTPNGGDVNGGTTITLGSEAVHTYYQWSDTEVSLTKDSEGWAEGKSVTAPNVTATKYLYAYATNGTGYESDVVSKAFNITKVKLAHGLAYAATAVTKKVGYAAFTNTLTNPNSLGVTYSIADGATATGTTVNASTGEVTLGETPGTATIKASFAGNDDYSAGEVSYILTLNAATVQADVTSAKTWDIENKVSYNGDRHTDGVYKLYDNIEGLTFDAEFDATSLLVKATSSNFAYRQSYKCAQGAYLKFHTTIPGTVDVTFSSPSSNDRTLVINGVEVATTTSKITGSASVSAGDVEITYTASIRIFKVVFTPTAEPSNPTTSGDETYLTTSDNMAGWRAFYDASNSYSVDGNTKVYVADVDPVGSTITMKSIDGVPANVPVILHTSSSADSYKMTLTKETGSPFSYTGTNKLEYTTSAVSEKYRLGYGASGVGFYPYSGTPASGAVILNVSSATARALTMVFDDSETTGISRIENSERIDNSVYNLRGQRVAQPTKGLYIVNGKKVMFK